MEIQNNDRIKQLIVRYVKGELSEGEMDELKRWRDERAEHEELFRNVVSMERLESGIRRFVKTPEQQELEWNRILSRTVRKKRRSWKMVWMRYAACAAQFSDSRAELVIHPPRLLACIIPKPRVLRNGDVFNPRARLLNRRSSSV